MRNERKQVNNIVLFEGHVRWIMERPTPEERLAAWETLAAIAFPQDGAAPYTPPEAHDGEPALSPCDRVRRDTYHMMSDFISSRVWELSGKVKNLNKSVAGKCGAIVRYGLEDSTDTMPDIDTTMEETCDEEAKSNTVAPPCESPQVQFLAFNDCGPLQVSHESIEAKEKERIAEWNKKFPDAKTLREWLERNYLFQNREIVCSQEFCDYAYTRLAEEDNWTSYKTGRVFRNIRNVIHWIALDFVKKRNEINRFDNGERRKDREVQFDEAVSLTTQKTSEDIADMERVRRRKAEREAVDKVLRGEL